MIRNKTAEKVAIIYAEYIVAKNEFLKKYEPNKYLSDLGIKDSEIKGLLNKIESCEKLITQRKFPNLYKDLKDTEQKISLGLQW